VLLINSIAPNPKPTYFRFQNQPIIVSPNIHVFKVKEEKVDVEYLISQLITEEFQSQVNAFAVGVTTLKRISASDFLNLRIKLPDLEEQKEIVRIQKEGIYSRKIAEALEFAQKSGITAKSEKELLGFVKHEIGNIAGGITNDIVNLKTFISRKGIDFNEKISGSKKAVSLFRVFDRMQSNTKDIENLMTNIEGIIYLADSQIQKSPVPFAPFVRSECEKVDLFKEKGIRLLLRGNDFLMPLYDEKVVIDKNQFSVVIRNFVINAIKHGFTDEITERIIVFQLEEDKDYHYINMINNGEPLPEDFTLEDYLKFGGRQNSEKGSGIGGFLIGKVIENHGGTIEMAPAGKTIYIEDDSELLEIKPAIALKTGVHFLIKLPKE
jgi:signal transduction histidine kinase